MSDSIGPYQYVRKLARLAVGGLVIFLGLALITSVAVTVALASGTGGWIVVAPWILSIFAEIVVVLLAFVAYGLIDALVSVQESATESARRLGRLESLLETQHKTGRKLVELASLSDHAKSLLFREREVEAFREIVHEDIMRQNYASAEALIESMESDLGCVEESRQLRQELEDSRKATLEEKIDAAVDRIQAFISRRDWERAIRESQRVYRLFPDNPKIASLPKRIESAKAEHKRELLERYGEAVRKKDVDESISLLRQLDAYLTPQEAAALSESARGVFKARLHQLGVQFAIRVTERQWTEAILAGETIIREFPNSRMAQEVRDTMDRLRDYADTAGQVPPIE